MSFTPIKLMKFIIKAKTYFIIGKLIMQFITKQLAFMYESSYHFATVCREAKSILFEFPLKKEELIKVEIELIEEIKSSEEFISLIGKTFP